MRRIARTSSLLALLLGFGCASAPRDFTVPSFEPTYDPMRSEAVALAAPAKEPARKGKSDEEPEHWNHLAVSIGAIHQRNEEGARFALEYERLLAPQWGIGGMVELDTPPVDTYTILVPGFFHPDPRLGLMAALGYNFETDSNKDDGFMLRLGITWKFEIGERFSIVPEVFYDILEGGNRGGVAAVAFGVGF